MLTPVSDKGLQFIKSFEGCRLTAYKDQGGVFTIGWGHTGYFALEGATITQALADSLFLEDVDKAALQVQNMLTHPATQGQYDALVSFAFNVGTEGLRGSTLLKLFNVERIFDAAIQFVLWSKVGSDYNEGLLRRRASEMVMFLTGNYVNA